MAKTCPNCKKTYMMAEKHFNIDRSRKDGLCFYCKTCTRELTAWYEEKGKAPKDKRTCEYSKCNNTFETRKKNKRFCCSSCNTKAYRERTGIEKVVFRQNFLRKLRRKKEPRPNGRNPWTLDEITELMEMRTKNISFKDIGELLGRSSEGCAAKYYLIQKKREYKNVK